MNSEQRSRLVHHVGNLLVFLCLGFIVVKLRGSFASLPKIIWDEKSLLAVISCTIFWTVGFVISTAAWILLLGANARSLTFRSAYIIMGKSQIAKYLPGNVFHYLGRIALSVKTGISTEAVVVSTGLEAILVACATAILALFDLLVDPGSIPVLARLMNSGSWLPVILLIAALALLGIGIFRRRIFKWVEQRREYFHWKNISAALLLYLAVFLFFGYFIALMLDGVWSVSYSWYRLSFGFAFSWLIGFIIPGAPGGIGIREVVFTGLFGSQLGEGVAIALALVIRIVTTLSDVVTFFLAYILSRLKPNA